MLSFFRRLTHSKAGVVITFFVLGVIALAFAASDITGLTSGTTTGIGGGDVASVGKADVTIASLKARVQNAIEEARQRQPTLDAAQFVNGGGLDSTLEREIATLALEQFGLQQGMVVSKRSVDGQIASIPALQGPNGRFDPATYQRLLASRGLTDAQVRADIARGAIVQLLIAPTQGASQMPGGVALPYASLLLERRTGQIALIPSAAMNTGPGPTDAELQAWYRRNIARYTLPERRIVRYAAVTPASINAQPTDAELAAAYAADRAKYTATEKRTIAQVVVADQAGAQALAARVRAGTDILQAARAIGLEASTQTAVDKAAYAAAASPALADAAFAAASGAVVGPLRGPLGWTVAKVSKVEQVAGRTLAQVRDEIATTLRTRKTAEGLAETQAAIDEALTKNATFDEVVADRKLAARTTPALVANGTDPLNPSPADPALAPIVTAAFQLQDGDPPSLVSTGPDGSFAVVALGRVVGAAPRPLADVRAAVTRDVLADRARQAARRVANTILAKVNGGTPLASAVAGTGAVVQPVATSRAELARNARGVAPPVALMFSMAARSTKTLEAANNEGWYVVRLDGIQAGDARGVPAIVQATKSELGRSLGEEYAQQFARAARDIVGVKRDAGALAQVRRDLLGQTGN
jgi:peptidyl-prolyl cis-trans isomerase D